MEVLPSAVAISFLGLREIRGIREGILKNLFLFRQS